MRRKHHNVSSKEPFLQMSRGVVLFYGVFVPRAIEARKKKLSFLDPLRLTVVKQATDK